MLEKSDLKVGALVWWTAERYFRSWSCPAIVTEVKEHSFRVRSLDDFKETSPLRMDDDMDPTSRREMRLATFDEVCRYLRDQMGVLELEARSGKGERAQRAYDDYQAQVVRFLGECGLTSSLVQKANFQEE